MLHSFYKYSSNTVLGAGDNMVKRTELCLHGACITVGKRQEGKNEERERGTVRRERKENYR